ncbi:MAG: PilT/PilU family type 4a pilus ATPase [Candidatus Pacebacteria bacterium]|nr:PilT/PilU family type 4a pilus ATPase [Candidatus Paceibacterota bacterium]
MDYKKLIQDLISAVIKENGSDIHLTKDQYPVIRTQGALHYLEAMLKLSSEDMNGIVTEILTPEYKEEFLKNKEIDFSFETEIARFRGSCFFAQKSIGVSLRLIPKKIKTLKELNLPPILETFAQKQQGFFLVVGPMGHGKSTTLASMVEMINQTKAEHIVTIEDPVEYIFQKGKSIIDQREVKIDTKDFPTALKSVFRQDADVIMIGEMRGLETISAAVTAAETGHLVFSTLHTNNASQTIDRIIDVFPSEQQNQIKIQLAASLLGVFSQRLVPRISGGMIPAYELLINNNAVANLIREGRTFEISNVIETSSTSGMISLNKSLEELVRMGEITLENARKYSFNPRELKG